MHGTFPHMAHVRDCGPSKKGGLHDIVASITGVPHVHNHSVHKVLKVYLHGIIHTTFHPLTTLHSITGSNIEWHIATYESSHSWHAGFSLQSWHASQAHTYRVANRVTNIIYINMEYIAFHCKNHIHQHGIHSISLQETSNLSYINNTHGACKGHRARTNIHT